MDCVILYRTHGGRVDFISEEEDGNINVVVFPDVDTAIDFTDHNRLLQAVPYQIVELDEL